MQKSKPRKKQNTFKNLFTRNRKFIFDAALANRKLSTSDAERVVASIAKQSRAYHGKLEDRPFLTWASEKAKDAANFFVYLNEPKAEYTRFVFKGIWSVLRHAKDLADYAGPNGASWTASDIAGDVWVWAFQHIDSLLTIHPEKPAKISTRLYAVARWIAKAWKKTRLRERERFLPIDMERIGDYSYIDLDGKERWRVAPEFHYLYLVEPDFDELEAVDA